MIRWMQYKQIDVVFRLCVYNSLLTSSLSLCPLTVGMVTVMPFSIVADMVINGRVSPFLVCLSMALIAIGFIGFCLSDFVAAREETTSDKQFAHQEAFLTRHAVDSAHHDLWLNILIGQSTVLENWYLKLHPALLTLLPTICEEGECQPSLDIPPSGNWNGSIIKYIFWQLVWASLILLF